MAKTEETKKESWGTWEELLLACAVKRHGTKNWDSVAMEIQNRSSAANNFIVTPQNCKQKYDDLHHRFMVKDGKIVDSDDKSETDHKKDDDKLIPWLDELRQLRVAELRREVQQYDVSIVSLQLKVNRLKEEREHSLREKESTDTKPDLPEERTEEEKKGGESEPERTSPAEVDGKPTSGDDSDRDNQSFNESNSTDLKGENRDIGGENKEKKPEPVQTATDKPDPVSKESPVDKQVGEGSYNGSSETIAKDSLVAPAVKKSSEAIPVRQGRESAELWESVAESKGGGGGEEGTKESSDVQSSASLSRRNRRRKIISGSSSGEERETDEVSPAIKRISVKSQPLVGFLDMIQSHKFGSVFESRLESQETAKYRNLIRQHIDLETIQTRLKECRYSGCSRKFFRDLLLLFNNAIVFFPKNSSESFAAIELRELVTKELSSRPSRNEKHPKQEQPIPPTTTAPPSQPPPPPPPPPSPSVPKPDPEPSESLLPKPKPSGPIIACRKRSSISAKASNSTTTTPAEKKRSSDKKVEEKPVVDRKQTDKDKDKDNSSAAAEQSLLNKRKGERYASGTRSSRSSSKNRNNNNTTNNNSKNSNQNQGPSSNRSSSAKGNDDNNSESKTEKEKKNNSNATTTVAKKRSVANFLNRMKRNSNSSNNGTLLETLKSSNNSSSSKGERGGGDKEEKKGGGGSGRKDHQTRQSSSGRRRQAAVKESSPPKRSVGRPPKRAPPAPPPPPSKRTREREPVEPEVRQPRKRTRR